MKLIFVLIIWLLCTTIMFLTCLPAVLLIICDMEEEWFYVGRKTIDKLIN